MRERGRGSEGARRGREPARVGRLPAPSLTWRVLFLGLFVVSSARPAHSERRRLRLGVQPIYALSVVDRRAPSGGGVGVDLAFGLTDALALRGTSFVAFHSAEGQVTGAPGHELRGPAGTLSSFGAFIGLTYALDVLRIVPAFDLGLGVVGLRGDSRFGGGASALALLAPITAFAVEFGFATDYLITRRWSVGFVVRYQALLSALSSAPSFLYVGPRISLSLPF